MDFSELGKEVNSMAKLAVKPGGCEKRLKVLRKINFMLSGKGKEGWFGYIYGSTANGLAAEDDVMDIYYTNTYPISHEEASDTEEHARPDDIRQIRTVALGLYESGMEQVRSNTHGKTHFCTFRDPKYDIRCDISHGNADDIRRTNLISEFLTLDNRVKPFLFALKQFIKSRGINDDTKGYLSSHAFVMMGLHFLIYVQDPPVLPSLHNIRSKGPPEKHICTKFTTLEKEFHKCVRIKNEHFGHFREDLKIESSVEVYWDGNNTKNVGQLVVEVFKWFSSVTHFSDPMSIHLPQGTCFMRSSWKRDAVVFMDPMDKTRNIANSCQVSEINYICKVFSHAYISLKRGSTFESILKEHVLIPRPVYIQYEAHKTGHRS